MQENIKINSSRNITEHSTINTQQYTTEGRAVNTQQYIKESRTINTPQYIKKPSTAQCTFTKVHNMLYCLLPHYYIAIAKAL